MCDRAVSATSEPVACRQLSLRAKVRVVVRADAATASTAAIAQSTTISSSRWCPARWTRLRSIRSVIGSRRLF
jgi:hypothetical protein